MQPRQTDVLIVGAGVIGSAVAYSLAGLGTHSVVAIDLDLEGLFSSSELNAGGVRATWAQEINILTSKASIDFYQSVAEEVGYRAVGYVWMHTPEKLQAALRAMELQRKLGCEVDAWDVAGLQARYPFIDKTEGLAGAVFGAKDGLVNPNRLKNYYREKARAQGARFENQCWLETVERNSDGTLNVALRRFLSPLSEEERLKLLQGESLTSVESQIENWKVDRLVNCAGPWAPQVARRLGYSLPSKAVRRQICIFDCKDVDLSPYGMMIDPSGVYFHPEATNGLAGFADPAEPAGISYRYDGENFFMEKIWAVLFERSSRFERLRHLTGWAGLYEVSPDDCSILGEVSSGPWAGKGRVFELHSFSGHGVMHSYAAARGLAEWMTSGRFQTLDLSALSSRRFESQQLIHEGWII